MRCYIDTSVWVVYTYARRKESNRFKAVERLIKEINSGKKIEAMTSVYSIVELYQVGIDTFDTLFEASENSKEAIINILQTKIVLLPMLSRIERLIHTRQFSALRDSTDLPHAILAKIWECDVIVAYDDHFTSITDIIDYKKPEEVLANFKADKK